MIVITTTEGASLTELDGEQVFDIRVGALEKCRLKNKILAT